MKLNAHFIISSGYMLEPMYEVPHAEHYQRQFFKVYYPDASQNVICIRTEVTKSPNYIFDIIRQTLVDHSLALSLAWLWHTPLKG